MEVFFSIRARLILSSFIVLLESFLKFLRGHSHFFSQIGSSLEMFHKSSMHIMFAMPYDFIAGFSVKNESERSFVFPHFSGDVVSSTKFIAESVSVGINQDSSNSSEGFSGKPLDLCVGVLGFNESGRVNLHVLHVNQISSDLLTHL